MQRISPKALVAGRRELNRRKESFVLRRTAELNATFLPPLHSYVVFCRPTPLQARPARRPLNPGTGLATEP